MNVSRKLFTRIGFSTGIAALCLDAATLRLPAQTSQQAPAKNAASSMPALVPRQPLRSLNQLFGALTPRFFHSLLPLP